MYQNIPTTRADTSAAANATGLPGNGAAGNGTAGNGAAGNGAARPTARTKCKLQVFTKSTNSNIGHGSFGTDLVFDVTNNSFIKDFEEPSAGGHSPFTLFLGFKAKEALNLANEEKDNIRKLIDDGKFDYQFFDEDGIATK